MEFTMLFLSEKLTALGYATQLFDLHHNKYTGVRLYDSHETPRADTIYVGDCLPPKVPTLCIVSHSTIIDNFTPKTDCLMVLSEESVARVCNQVLSIVAKLEEDVRHFENVAHTEHNLQLLIEMFYDIVGNCAYLVDSSFKAVAIDRSQGMRDISRTWRRIEDDGYLPFELVSGLINTGELAHMEQPENATFVNSKYFYTTFINYNLRYNGEILGHLFVVGNKKRFAKSDIEIVEHLSQFVAYAMIHNRHFQNQHGNYYEYFMRDLYSGKLTDEESIINQMQFLNFDNTHYYTVVILHATAEHRLLNTRISNQIAAIAKATPVIYDGKIVTLFCHGSTICQETLSTTLKSIQDALSETIGVSDTFCGFFDLATYYRQAARALEYAKTDICYYRDIAIRHIVHNFCDQEGVKLLILPELQQLQVQKPSSYPELMETLYAYLLCERRTLETANLLYIHRNTLFYRINLITQLCNFDLEDPMLRQRLLLALEAIRSFRY